MIVRNEQSELDQGRNREQEEGSVALSGSPVDRYLGKSAAPAMREEPKDLGFKSDAAASPRMIDFVAKNGDHTALPYGYLVSARLIGGEKVELEFTEKKVTIRGRNLAPLYQHILAQVAARIDESDTGFDDDRQQSFVETIAIEVRS